MRSRKQRVEQTFALAKDQYTALGVDVHRAMQRLATMAISLHCWQGDQGNGLAKLGDIGGYPGQAPAADELREDIDKAMSLIPGRHRLSLYASHAETGGAKVERNDLDAAHFRTWIAWAKDRRVGLDFHPSYFAHPKAADGFTLAHRDEGIRRFWIEHGIACRQIGAAMGQALGQTCVTNVWIPDSFKDSPIDRKGPRQRLAQSLDAIFAERIDGRFHRDAIEGQVFGPRGENCVAGSHDFYLGYAVANKKLLCLAAGHYPPSEVISDQISSVLTWLDEMVLHVRRGVRWESDHVVTLTDELYAIAQELVRGDYLERVHIGLDFYDASINRVAAWVIGTRCMLKALLAALLEPTALLREREAAHDYTARLALVEEIKMLPLGAVWDYYCLTAGVPIGAAWLEHIGHYERDVLSRRK